MKRCLTSVGSPSAIRTAAAAASRGEATLRRSRSDPSRPAIAAAAWRRPAWAGPRAGAREPGELQCLRTRIRFGCGGQSCAELITRNSKRQAWLAARPIGRPATSSATWLRVRSAVGRLSCSPSPSLPSSGAPRHVESAHLAAVSHRSLGRRRPPWTWRPEGLAGADALGQTARACGVSSAADRRACRAAR